MRKLAKREVKKRVNFQGMDLAIEYPRGSQRSFEDDRGKTHYKTMRADYGEVRGTEGLDGDAVDVYVGPDKASDRVFVVTQMKKNDWDKVDEEKCVLGVRTKDQARALYLAHYDDPRFCGSIKELSMTDFKDRLATRGTVGKKIASAGAHIAELNYLRLQAGEPVLVQDAHGVKVGADEDFAEYPAEEPFGRRAGRAAGRFAKSPLGVGIAAGGAAAHLTKGLPTPARAGLTTLSAIGAHQVASRARDQYRKHKGRYDMGREVEEYRKQASVEPWSPALERAREAQRKFAGSENDPDPQWDNDLSDELKRKMKKEAPQRFEDMRRSAIAKTDVTKQEQIGLGIKDNDAEDDPKDSKMRKAAEVARVDLFIKEAREGKDRAPTAKQFGARLGSVVGGFGGAALGARAFARPHYGPRGVMLMPSMGGAVTGGMVGALAGGAVGRGAGSAYSEHAKEQRKKSPGRRWGERALTAAGIAGGVVAGRKGMQHLVRTRTGEPLKKLLVQKVENKVKDLRGVHDALEGMPGAQQRTLAKLKEVEHALGKVRARPAAELGDDATRAQLARGGIGGGVAGGLATVGGIKAYDHLSRKRQKKASNDLSPRAQRVANALDNAGIATLASPYVGEGLRKHLGKRRGILGLVGRAGGAYHDWFPTKNRNEILGLAAVSHAGMTQGAKAIDRVLPGKAKTSYAKQASIPNPAVMLSGLAGAARPIAQRAVGAVRGAAGRVRGALQGAAPAQGPQQMLRLPRPSPAAVTGVEQVAQTGLPRGRNLIGGMVNQQNLAQADAVLMPSEVRRRAVIGAGSKPVAQARQIAQQQQQMQQLGTAHTIPSPVPMNPVLTPAIPPPPRMPTGVGTIPPPSRIPAAAGGGAPIARTIPSPPPANMQAAPRPRVPPPPPPTRAQVAQAAPAQVVAPAQAAPAQVVAPPPAPTQSIAPPAATNAAAPPTAGAGAGAPATAPAAAVAAPPAGAPAVAPANAAAAAPVPAKIVTVKGKRVMADANGRPIIDQNGNYIDPELTGGEKVWEGTKSIAKNVRNTALFGLGAAGLGVGTAGIAAANVLGGGHGAVVSPGYYPPTQ